MVRPKSAKGKVDNVSKSLDRPKSAKGRHWLAKVSAGKSQPKGG